MYPQCCGQMWPCLRELLVHGLGVLQVQGWCRRVGGGVPRLPNKGVRTRVSLKALHTWEAPIGDLRAVSPPYRQRAKEAGASAEGRR